MQESGSRLTLELLKIMQQNRSKRYRAAAEQVDRNKAYNLNEAVSALKKMPATKFDQTVTVSFRLGVDPKQSDQMVRGTCPLPHGSGKQVRVLVFAEGAAAKAAKDAGAEYVGFKDMIQKCQEGFRISMSRSRRRPQWLKCASSARCSVRVASCRTQDGNGDG
jgi:Ribosomal protein L1